MRCSFVLTLFALLRRSLPVQALVVRSVSGNVRSRPASLECKKLATFTVLVCVFATSAVTHSAPATQSAPATESAPARIVSADASITGIMLELGAGERLVGVDVTSQLPPALGALPRIGYHRALSAEGIASLKPDLVLGSEHAGPPPTLAALRAMRLPLVQLPVPLTVDSLQRNIRSIAAVLDDPRAGDALAARVESRHRELALRALPAPRTVLLRESDGSLRVAGKNTAGAAFIDLIGGANAVDYAGYRSFSTEALLALKPQVLLIAVSPGGESVAQWLRRFPMLRYSDAVESASVAFVSASALVGGVSVAAIAEAEVLVEQLRSAVVSK